MRFPHLLLLVYFVICNFIPFQEKMFSVGITSQVSHLSILHCKYNNLYVNNAALVSTIPSFLVIIMGRGGKIREEVLQDYSPILIFLQIFWPFLCSLVCAMHEINCWFLKNIKMSYIHMYQIELHNIFIDFMK